MLSRRFRALGAIVVVAMAAPVMAIPDAANDFLATYTGPAGGDLDVVSSEVTLFAGTFVATATLNAPIGTTPGALYVWGFDRGAGTARFQSGSPPIGSGVLFDSVLVVRPDLTGSITRITDGGSTNLAPGSVNVSGNTISAVFPTSALPTQGFTTPNYTWNLWPRVGSGQNAQVSDFAPDNSNAAVVPEPTAAGLLFVAGGLLLRLKR